MGVILNNDLTLIEKKYIFLYLLLNFLNSSNPFVRQIYIIIFDLLIFLLYSILIYGCLSEKSILILDGNCLRMCALTDTQSNYFPLKLTILSIFKSLDIVDCWLPSFVHHFLKQYIVPDLVRNINVWKLVLRSCYGL